MATLIVFSDVDDGYLISSDAVYANALAGTGVVTPQNGLGVLLVGQDAVFDVSQAFLHFDTSGQAATPTTATLSLAYASDNSITDFTLEAFVAAWTAPLASAALRSPAQLGALTLAASFPSASVSLGGGQQDFASASGFPGSISLGGITNIVIASSRNRTSTTPTGNEYVSAGSAEQGGTTLDPTLTLVTHVNTGLFQRNAAFGLLGVM